MLKDFFSDLVGGICAGILISIGGTVFLSCESKVVGSVLFTVALLTICMQGYLLYTGKICYLFSSDKKGVSLIFTCLLGNVIGTTVCGLLLSRVLPIGDIAYTICTSKLTQEWWQTIVRGIFCGILIYLAVDIFKEKKGISGIIYCIPVFILSGFEHSIADMFYFAASGIVSFEAFMFLMMVVIGNSIGGFLLPLFSKLRK